MRRSFLSDLGGVLSKGMVELQFAVPSVDRDGRPVDHVYWREEALRLLGTLFGGATALPQGRGVWRDDERGGELVVEDVSIIFCWVHTADLSAAAVQELRRFLHRLGRETRQGAVTFWMHDGRQLSSITVEVFDKEVTR
jgi:hypothetical protein